MLGQVVADRKVRTFTLNPAFVEEFQGKQPNWGYQGLGYFTYKRTYSREKPDGTTEEWWETCKRVVEGVYNIQKVHCRTFLLPWNEPKAQKSAQEMFQRMWDFKFLPPGRGLWAMGTDMVYEKGSACLNNCAYVSSEGVDTDFAAPFCFLMDMTMLGVGVGGDCRGAGKVRLSLPKMTDEPFVVEDSREGWVDFVRVVLNSFVGKGRYPATVDFTKVRPRGAPIVTFGGVASGALPLVKLAESLTRLLMPKGVGVVYDVEIDADDRVLYARAKFEGEGEPFKVGSSHIVDIFNFIGKCVVAGGVRRSSEIMFGEPDDVEFVTLKQDKEALKERRWASNNSIFARVGMDYAEVAKSIEVNGEPGLVWMDNIRAYSRMDNKPDHKDRRAMGSNPCSEQSLESYEVCCLVETFPAHHDTFEDFKRTLKFAYLYAKTVTLIPTHDMRTNAVMMRNRRIGCSMSGITQAMLKLGRRKYLNWCDTGYGYIQNLDLVYSEWLCVPRSLKTTSVKPSGTVSLLCGATPGIHYPESEFYIRRIRVQNTSPLVQACRDAGYHVEKDTYADDTSVVEFPVRQEFFAKGKTSVSLWEQMQNAADLQRYWADNQVSVTVTFKPEEAKDLPLVLSAFEDKLKSVSFLPLGEENHGYVQAPYEEISRERYEAMAAPLKPLVFTQARNEVRDLYCDGGKCSLRPPDSEG